MALLKQHKAHFVCSHLCEACPFFQNQYRNIGKNVSLKYPWVIINQKATKLPAATYRVLCCLVEARGSVVSRAEILQYAWGNEEAVLNNVNVAVSELRMLLKPTEIKIITKRKHGYFIINSGDTL
ncbi:winged helix-turn-helix domain-containing protein [Idiomarina seosinensis]|uniref:winged helix-turn-helix domain-containing protein n=1 Tax=Idiomarina seosinensis TaxID=281739 RepID=UPI0038503CDD